MSEKKDRIDSFFDAMDKVAGSVEKTLKNAHHPGKVYPEAEDAEVIAFEKQPDVDRLRQLAGELNEMAKRYSSAEVRVSIATAHDALHRAAVTMTSQVKRLPESKL